MPPEIKYLSEFDVSEISRTTDMEKIAVYSLGIVFLRILLLIDENEF